MNSAPCGESCPPRIAKSFPGSHFDNCIVGNEKQAKVFAVFGCPQEAQAEWVFLNDVSNQRATDKKISKTSDKES